MSQAPCPRPRYLPLPLQLGSGPREVGLGQESSEGLWADPGGTPSHPLESQGSGGLPHPPTPQTYCRQVDSDTVPGHTLHLSPRLPSRVGVLSHEWSAGLPRGSPLQAEGLVPIGRPASLPKALATGRAKAWVSALVHLG